MITGLGWRGYVYALEHFVAEGARKVTPSEDRDACCGTTATCAPTC
jgi:hypothetical protein